MIEKTVLKTLVEEWLAGNDYFLVDLVFTPDDRIVVEIDHAYCVCIFVCAEFCRFLEL